MLVKFEIKHVQHVGHLSLAIDLDDNKVTCIVGKNGVGKTTLIRAIRNLSHSDTFLSTASRGIFDKDSSIAYVFGERHILFEYDNGIQSLNCKTSIPEEIRSMCAVELSMPHGERFRYFRTVSEADTDIRRQIILEEYTKPTELIEFLSAIYTSDKFQRLVEINVRGRNYYCILLDDSRYVREDYLSSGEYFLINLYRTIRSTARLIVVDEIDISLDAAAQVHLLKALRGFCAKYGRNIVFTTHSLAMMRTLDTNELVYMELKGVEVRQYPASYSYIKTLLFGFSGWDRYILTEDVELQGLLETLIQRYCKEIFFTYKIIYVGGGGQVADLLRRNRAEGFLSESPNVMAVLDGDQSIYGYAQDPDIHFLPIENVENALLGYYHEPNFPYRLPQGVGFSGAKSLFRSLQKEHVMSVAQIFECICDRDQQKFLPLIGNLKSFLSRPV